MTNGYGKDGIKYEMGMGETVHANIPYILATLQGIICYLMAIHNPNNAEILDLHGTPDGHIDAMSAIAYEEIKLGKRLSGTYETIEDMLRSLAGDYTQIAKYKVTTTNLGKAPFKPMEEKIAFHNQNGEIVAYKPE